MLTMNRDRLHCIDLDQPALEGFRQFISSWFYQGEGWSLLVDPGPLSTIPHLVAELQRLGVKQLDYILLTHIHIDHAGGTGALLKAFPMARVICHPEGVRHLIAPEKLWQGSQQVLGKLAEVYGEILPVPAEQIGFEETIGRSGVRVFLTPGHAVHHCCYLLDDLLFAGEVAGVRGEIGEGIFIRPATPPRFLLNVALDSIERMLALEPRAMVFGHYGLAEDAMEHLRIAHGQLRLWVQGVAITAPVAAEEREAALIAWLREHDVHYRNVDRLPIDLQARERYFLGNSLRGMIEYVDSLPLPEQQALAAGEGSILW